MQSELQDMYRQSHGRTPDREKTGSSLSTDVGTKAGAPAKKMYARLKRLGCCSSTSKSEVLLQLEEATPHEGCTQAA